MENVDAAPRPELTRGQLATLLVAAAVIGVALFGLFYWATFLTPDGPPRPSDKVVEQTYYDAEATGALRTVHDQVMGGDRVVWSVTGDDGHVWECYYPLDADGTPHGLGGRANYYCHE